MRHGLAGRLRVPHAPGRHSDAERPVHANQWRRSEQPAAQFPDVGSVRVPEFTVFGPVRIVRLLGFVRTPGLAATVGQQLSGR